MRRRLFTLAALLSLVLCLATAALWLRQYLLRKHPNSDPMLAVCTGPGGRIVLITANSRSILIETLPVTGPNEALGDWTVVKEDGSTETHQMTEHPHPGIWFAAHDFLGNALTFRFYLWAVPNTPTRIHVLQWHHALAATMALPALWLFLWLHNRRQKRLRGLPVVIDAPRRPLPAADTAPAPRVLG